MTIRLDSPWVSWHKQVCRLRDISFTNFILNFILTIYGIQICLTEFYGKCIINWNVKLWSGFLFDLSFRDTRLSISFFHFIYSSLIIISKWITIVKPSAQCENPVVFPLFTFLCTHCVPKSSFLYYVHVDFVYHVLPSLFYYCGLLWFYYILHNFYVSKYLW